MAQVLEKKNKGYLFVCPKCGKIFKFEGELGARLEPWYCRECGPEAVLKAYGPKAIKVNGAVIVKGEEHAEPYYKYAEKITANELFTFWCPKCGKTVKKTLGRYVCKDCRADMETLYSFKKNKSSLCNVCPIRPACEEKDLACKALITYYSEVFGADPVEESELSSKYGYNAWLSLKYQKPVEYV